jgi:hypothetical protein
VLQGPLSNLRVFPVLRAPLLHHRLPHRRVLLPAFQKKTSSKALTSNKVRISNKVRTSSKGLSIRKALCMSKVLTSSKARTTVTKHSKEQTLPLRNLKAVEKSQWRFLSSDPSPFLQGYPESMKIGAGRCHRRLGLS